MLDIERLFESIFVLSLDLTHHKDEQVADRIVQDQIRAKGLSEFVDQRQTMHAINKQKLPSFLDLHIPKTTFALCIQSNKIAVISIMP